MKNRGYRTIEEVVRGLGVPVLAAVPEMVTPSEYARRRRRRQLTAVFAGLLVAAVAIAVGTWALLG